MPGRFKPSRNRFQELAQDGSFLGNVRNDQAAKPDFGTLAALRPRAGAGRCRRGVLALWSLGYAQRMPQGSRGIPIQSRRMGTTYASGPRTSLQSLGWGSTDACQPHNGTHEGALFGAGDSLEEDCGRDHVEIKTGHLARSLQPPKTGQHPALWSRWRPSHGGRRDARWMRPPSRPRNIASALENCARLRMACRTQTTGESCDLLRIITSNWPRRRKALPAARHRGVKPRRKQPPRKESCGAVGKRRVSTVTAREKLAVLIPAPSLLQVWSTAWTDSNKGSS